MLLSAAEGVGRSRNGCIMTKDRARKQAARRRAAVTGESYVVAQRAVAGPQQLPRDAGRMHELTHKVPGVPAHVEGGLQGGVSSSRKSRPQLGRGVRGNEARVHGEPRVLVGWQNWIARRVSGGKK